MFARLAACLSLLALGASAAPLRIDTGLLSGTVADGMAVYKGIPFAAPPVGANRWRPPQPAAKWDGVRTADSFGPQCMQTPYPVLSLFYSPAGKQSEDCLYLNVWSATGGSRKPVMVWIHGGAWTRGSADNTAYDGAALARKGIVVVTVNYRLGAFGFLAHPGLTAESPNHSSGWYGVLDQIAALQWVRRNIRAFGGDPENVTIFGESAGAWSVNVLVASPLAKGLFHRAIAESGALFGPMAKLVAAEQAGVRFAKGSSLAELRALPAEAILKMPDAPSSANVDGWVLPDDIRTIFARGQQNDVPVLIGNNANEMTSLSVRATLPKTIEQLRNRVRPLVGDRLEEFEKLYGAEADPEGAWLAAARDVTFTLPMRTWARANRKAWLYWFSHAPANPLRNYLGAYHAGEILYVFDNLKLREQAWTEIDHKLAETMSNYWVAFAKTGKVDWPAYDREQEHYIDFGDTVAVKQHLQKERLDFLESMR